MGSGVTESAQTLPTMQRESPRLPQYIRFFFLSSTAAASPLARQGKSQSHKHTVLDEGNAPIAHDPTVTSCHTSRTFDLSPMCCFTICSQHASVSKKLGQADISEGGGVESCHENMGVETPVRQRFARIVHRLQVLFELAVALDCTVLRHIVPAVDYNHAADHRYSFSSKCSSFRIFVLH